MGDMDIAAVRTLSAHKNNRTNGIEVISEPSEAVAAVYRVGSLRLNVVVRNKVPAPHSYDAV